MLTVLALVFTCAVAAYLFYSRRSKYWKERNIPGPTGSFFLGSARELLLKSNPRAIQFNKWTKEYGKTYGVMEGIRPLLVTSDLNIVQEVFVKQFDNFHERWNMLTNTQDNNPKMTLFESRGTRWKRLRAISSPSFSVGNLKKVRPIVEDSARCMVEIMEKRHADGAPFNIHEFYMEYTMDTIGRLVIGQKESRYFENERVSIMKNIFMREFDNPIIRLNIALPILNRPTIFLMETLGSVLTDDSDKLFKDVQENVKQRIVNRAPGEATERKFTDFIDLFLNSATDEKLSEEFVDFKLNEAQVSKTLSVNEVVAQAVIFLIAGFDTTANALGYTSWMLAKHPEVLKRCQEEVDEFCPEESISYEDLSNLRYLEATCKEALRFYPLAAFANSRICVRKADIQGLIIEEGTAIAADALSIHFDRDIWGDDVDEFNPDRWLNGSTSNVPPYAYLPFGAGPRICVGMRLAMLEEKLALAHLLRKFSIVTDAKDEELKVHGCITITPVEVPVRIERRR